LSDILQKFYNIFLFAFLAREGMPVPEHAVAFGAQAYSFEGEDGVLLGHFFDFVFISAATRTALLDFRVHKTSFCTAGC